jgi:hypothetical protein
MIAVHDVQEVQVVSWNIAVVVEHHRALSVASDAELLGLGIGK